MSLTKKQTTQFQLQRQIMIMRKKSCHSADLSIFSTFFCVCNLLLMRNLLSKFFPMLPFVPLHSKCILLSIQVLFYEMRGIKKACTELEKSYKPKITFIVTVKRHHGRFAVINQRNKVDCSLSFIYLFIAKIIWGSWARFSCVFAGLLSLLEIMQKRK